MGRVKTIRMKRIARKLFQEQESGFSQDFNRNKTEVSRLTDVTSKKLRNIISGYITRLVKQKSSNKLPGRYVQHEDLSKYYN